MAYDAATGTVVLFGGNSRRRALADTWTWDGSTWTQQHPAVHPATRIQAAAAYDAATSSVVLFGGQGTSSGRLLGDTWTWNGTIWTQQAPASSPSARDGAAMAYDVATGNVMLFGGNDLSGFPNDTWTWG